MEVLEFEKEWEKHLGNVLADQQEQKEKLMVEITEFAKKIDKEAQETPL